MNNLFIKRYKRVIAIMIACLICSFININAAFADVTTALPDGYNDPHCTEYKNIADLLSNLNQSGTIAGVEINKYTPIIKYVNNNPVHAYLGCAPVAMGTIENFHLKPEGYSLNHNDIDDDLAKLLANHGVVSEWFPQIVPGTSNINYFAPDGTSCKCAIKPLVLGVFGYDVEQVYLTKAGARDRATELYNIIKSEVNQNRPILLDIHVDNQGGKVSGDINHTIVITGYKKHSWKDLLGLQREDIFAYAVMGWGGSQNGWWQIDNKHFVVGAQKYDLNNIYIYKAVPRSSGNYDKMLTDVSTDHWAYAYIRQLYEGSVINGYGLDHNNTYYLPDAEIKRYEAIAMILRACGIPVDNNQTAEAKKFTDLKNSTNQEMLACIGTAVKKGLVDAYSKGNNENFRATASITRGEFAKILVKSLNLTGKNLAVNRAYPGAGPFGELENYLVQLYRAKIIDGYYTSTVPDLKVDGKVTRAAAAKFVRNAISL